MEQAEQNAEARTPQEFASGWTPLNKNNPPGKATHHPSPPPQDSMDGPSVERFRGHRAAPHKEPDVEGLLTSLDAVAHKLASAESADVLPLALSEFLAFCHARSGLVLTYPQGANACHVTIRRHMPEDLAALFEQEPCFWATPSAHVQLIAPGKSRPASADSARIGSALEARLADSGVKWFAWLPLKAAGRAEVVFVALGDSELPAALKQRQAHLALTLLGDLIDAALEQERLRSLFSHNEHTRDEFLKLASHELKSPLTVVKGYSQLLLRQARRRGTASEAELEALEIISQQVNRMSHLVAELLDFSRIERAALEVALQPVELVGLVRRVLEQRQRSLPDRAFRLIAGEPQVTALADPVRLEQVLGYLLDNAVKFGPENGLVEVTVQRVSADRVPSQAPPLNGGRVETGPATPQGEVALISVRDYGPGLPAGERDRLFTAFYRGPDNSIQRQFAGLGLGLYLSRYFIAHQNGYLWAEFPTTDRSTGSIFHVSLPLAPAA